MPENPFDRATWISRPVEPRFRQLREARRSRIDWAEPGVSLAQTFSSDGPVESVSFDIAGPPTNTYTADVAFTLRLETEGGELIAQQRVDGPQLVWDRLSQLLAVTPAAPPGTYRAVLTVEQEVIGWHVSDEAPVSVDDGVSPLHVVGDALRDGRPVPGTRVITVDTTPAPNPLFRTSLEIDGAIHHAVLHAVVLGCGVVSINGRRVSDELLAPAVTDYDKSVLFRPIEVTPMLQPGRNELVIAAGRERFSARGGDTWGWNSASWHREPMALVALDVAYADGSTTRVVSGPDWQTAASDVTERFYVGEHWSVGAPPAGWTSATTVEAPRGRLRPALQPPVVAGTPIPPLTTERIEEGRSVLDFGAVMTGRIRCIVSGPAGSSVRVTTGEQRDEKGRVVCDNTLVAGDAQRDVLELRAPALDLVWEPLFGYRGFRWAQIDRSGGAEVRFVRAVPIETPLTEVGEFSSSNECIEWIDGALARTFRNNLHGVPTDTPIYEKNGWTADAHLAAEALIHRFDLLAPFTKWMDDHVDAQGDDGSIPQIVPTPGWGRASDPAWSSSAVIIPWLLYEEYGRVEILEPYAGMIERFALQLVERCGGRLWPDRSWGDWLAPGFQFPPEGTAPTATAMAIHALRIAAKILQVVGRTRADELNRHADVLDAAYNDAYLDADRGIYEVAGVGYRQSLNVLALAFDIVPMAHRTAVETHLIADIEGRTAGHLDCGSIAVRHLPDVLERAGRDDLAITILTNLDRPGWGVWFAAGERTLLESWDRDARSRNHYFLGSVASWIHQRVGGMRRTEPGWRRFRVAPIDDTRVDRASITHRTPLGIARVAWQRGPGGWRLDVTVPEGSVAEIAVGAHTFELAAGAHDLVIAG